MSKICAFCCKKIKGDDEKCVIHDKCFEKYKHETKTFDNYIFLSGKYRGLSYVDVKNKYPSYLEWISKQKFDEGSPLAYAQNYHKKFSGDPVKKYVKKEVKEETKVNVSEAESEDEILNI